MTVTINNNEVSPTFSVPYYDLIIPETYTQTFDIDYGECEWLSEYVNIDSEANPGNKEQTFNTFSVDLSNVYEFNQLSCLTT